jgi:hypothetical protein
MGGRPARLAIRPGQSAGVCVSADRSVSSGASLGSGVRQARVRRRIDCGLPARAPGIVPGIVVRRIQGFGSMLRGRRTTARRAERRADRDDGVEEPRATVRRGHAISVSAREPTGHPQAERDR